MLRDFEGELARTGDAGDMPALAAVVVGSVEGLRTVGLAMVDPGMHTLLALEFADDDHFCLLESALLQLSVRECCVVKDESGSADNKRLLDALARCGAVAAPRPRGAFSTKNLDQDLQRLLGSPGMLEQQRHVVEGRYSSSAVAGLLGFAELLADTAGHGRFVLERPDLGRFMRLDAAAQRALSVTRVAAGSNGATPASSSQSTFSLFGLLDRCRSAMGKRLLRRWLKQPLLDLEELRARHDVVEAIVEDVELRQALRDIHLRGMPDLELLNRKLERGRASLSDLCQMYRASSRLPMVEQALRAHKGPHAAVLRDR